jgi:hypothetical protein
MKKIILCSAVGSLLCAACATVPVPHEQKSASEAAVRGAQEAGADDAPQAKLALQLSRDEIGQGDQLVAQGKNTEAAAMFDRARADAELAVGLTREAEAVKQGAKVAALKAAP